MPKTRLIATSVATLSCALGVGYFMQHTGVPETTGRMAASVMLLPQPAVIAEPLDLSQIILTSAPADLAPMDVAEEPMVAKPQPLAQPADCTVSVAASTVEPASVALDIAAPCNRNDRITVHHSGMMFTLATDTTGAVSVTVPALNSDAIFIVETPTGGAVASAEVPSLSDYDRVALQWTGETGLQIHAREYEADYGSGRHVWTGHAVSDGPVGGSVVRLGDPDTLNPRLAEVYTFPASRAVESGTVALTVEAEVTEANCGRDIAAQSITPRGAESAPRTRDLVLSVPDCDAKGDFLVLNNLLDDLKIAAN